VGEVGAQRLHRDAAVEPEVVREVHLGHASGAEEQPQFVPVAEDRRRRLGEGQIVWSTEVHAPDNCTCRSN
jgi:hypothetical protein